jgi:hypothetical protein
MSCFHVSTVFLNLTVFAVIFQPPAVHGSSKVFSLTYIYPSSLTSTFFHKTKYTNTYLWEQPITSPLPTLLNHPFSDPNFIPAWTLELQLYKGVACQHKLFAGRKSARLEHGGVCERFVRFFCSSFFLK